MTRPAVFLDRDGTLNAERGYLADPRDAVLLPGAVESLGRLRERGFVLVVVTNQSGIARGLLSESDLARIHWRLRETLGGVVAAWLHCPHHPDVGDRYRRPCDCRKPAPGLLLRGARLLDLDLERSWTIGDSARDVLAGHAAGTRTVLVESGKPPAEQLAALDAARIRPDLVAKDLPAAVAAICG